MTGVTHMLQCVVEVSRMVAVSGHGECFHTAGIRHIHYPRRTDLLLSYGKCWVFARALQQSDLSGVLLKGEGGSLTLEAPAHWGFCRGHQ